MLARFDRVPRHVHVLVLTAALAGCAARQKAAHLFAPGEGECTESGGCAAPIETGERYELPDAERPSPEALAAQRPT